MPAGGIPTVGDQGRRRGVPVAAASVAWWSRKDPASRSGHRRYRWTRRNRLSSQRSPASAEDYAALRNDTAGAKLIEYTNHLTKEAVTARAAVEPLVLMVAPLAPHLAEELWRGWGTTTSLAHGPFPVADEAYLVDDTVEYPVQVNGRCGATSRWRPTPPPTRSRRGARRREGARVPGRRDAEEGHRRRRPPGQPRRLACPAELAHGVAVVPDLRHVADLVPVEVHDVDVVGGRALSGRRHGPPSPCGPAKTPKQPRCCAPRRRRTDFTSAMPSGSGVSRFFIHSVYASRVSIPASASVWLANVAPGWQYGAQPSQPLPVSHASKNCSAVSLIVLISDSGVITERSAQEITPKSPGGADDDFVDVGVGRRVDGVGHDLRDGLAARNCSGS